MRATTCFLAFFAASSAYALPANSLVERMAGAEADGNLVNVLVATTGLSFSNKSPQWANLWGGSQCDLTKPVMPSDSAASTPLPTPKGNLAHVAIGRGTQNYTCDTANPSAAPVAIGALASLYDASCVASNFGWILNYLPMLGLALPNPAQDSTAPFLGLSLLGHHYFTDPKSPVFNLDTANGNKGYAPVSKIDSANAPADAVKGQYGACAWLYLTKSTTAQVKVGQQTYSEVYRVSTASGNAPSTCQGMQSSFTVDYSALYWFYGQS